MDAATAEQKIEQICKVWTERVDPEKIILFGSAAHGKTDHGSDLDFLVVWEGEPFPDNRRRAAHLRKLLVGEVRAPVDILVLTPEQYREAASDPATFTSMIVREGRMLYERIA